MSEVYSPYSEAINNTTNTVNYNTGTFISRVPIATISSGLESTAVFQFDICVGVTNMFPNEYALEGRGYMYTTPRIIRENLASIFPEIWLDGKVERLSVVKVTESKDEWLHEYAIIHSPVKNIKIFFHERKDHELNSWHEVTYADGTVDIFNGEGEIKRRISPAGHSLKFVTYAVNKYESLLLSVEDEYHHGKIEISYGEVINNIQEVKVIETLGENRNKLTEIKLKRLKDANIKVVEDIRKFNNLVPTVGEADVSYGYTRFEDGNYYITSAFIKGLRKISLEYSTVKYIENKDIYVITKAIESETNPQSFTKKEYVYSKNTYTGLNGKGWQRKRYYDSCMYMPDDNYQYSVSEIYSVIDPNYPNDNTELFCTRRTFNKYHLLIEEESGLVNNKDEWIKKIKTEQFTYGNMLIGQGENITNQPGNYSYWTKKTTMFHDKDNLDLTEVEYRETFENGLPSKIIDKNGVEKNLLYYVDPDLGSATKVITLLKEVITRSRQHPDPLDFHDKKNINYVKIAGKVYSKPDIGLVIKPFLYLPSEVLVYKNKIDSGLVVETNKYYDTKPSGDSDYFFLGYMQRTSKQGDLTVGNCLYENTIYSYLDSKEKLLLVQSYRSNIAKKGDKEEKTIIKCSVINPVMALPIREWYQLSLENNTKYDEVTSTYDNFGRLLSKISEEGLETYVYDKNITRDPYDSKDLCFYLSYNYTDVYGLKKIVFYTTEGRTVKIYGLHPKYSNHYLLEKNKYMAGKYLKEHITNDYEAGLSNSKIFVRKITHDYKEFKLLKTTFPDGTFETYENDEYLKRKKIKKNHCLTEFTSYDAFGKILNEGIENLTSSIFLKAYYYDEYNQLIAYEKYDRYYEEYFYDNFHRLVEKNVNPGGHIGSAYKEKLTYPATALNSDKAIIKTCNNKWGYSVKYNNYGEVICENDNNYEYDSLKEKQLKKVYNGVGEVNYTYSDRDLPEEITYTQKNTEEPFKTVYDKIYHNKQKKLSGYSVKNFDHNVEKNCGEMGYAYTDLGKEEYVTFSIGEKENNLQVATMMNKRYSKFENFILNTSYSHLRTNVENTYDEASSNLERVKYTFADLKSITFELTYNKDAGISNYNFGQLETITMVAPNFSINTTLKFDYDEQGREEKRSYYNTKNAEEVLLVVETEYGIDSKIISIDISSPERTINRINYYDSETGKLEESRKSYGNSGYFSTERIYSEIPDSLSMVGIIDGKKVIKDNYIHKNQSDSLKSFIQSVDDVIVVDENIGEDPSGNYTNDLDNKKIIYNVANKIINVEKKETLQKYNYYYYMSGELMCVSEMKENPRKIYYLYDNGKNIGELIYEGAILKIATLYLDVCGIRLGRYIQDYELQKNSIELFFSELGGTVHKELLYEENIGVAQSATPDYGVYGETEEKRYSVSQYLGEHKHIGLKTATKTKVKVAGLFTTIKEI